MTAFDEHAVASCWDALAPDWIHVMHTKSDLVRELFINPTFLNEFVPKVSEQEVIDLGCGEGSSARALARNGAKVTGVDLSRLLLGAAQEQEVREPLGISYLNCSFADLQGIGEKSFDAAVSMMALMDAPRLFDSMKAAFRVLRPGAAIYISVIHPCFWATQPGLKPNEEGGQADTLARDYWDESPYVESGRYTFSGHGMPNSYKVLRFPYRLESYFAALHEAGFKLLRVHEPKPSAELARLYPSIFGPFGQQIPLFLYIAGTK